MNKTFSKFTIIFTSFCLSIATFQRSEAQISRAFICQVDSNNIPTTYAQTPEGDIAVFVWSSKYFKPPYTPTQRCNEVSQRMNNFNSKGALQTITSGSVNKLPVLCAGSVCEPNGSNVLLTLKPGQNPNQVLEEMQAIRSRASASASHQFAGSSTTGSRNNFSSIKNNPDGTVSVDMNELLRSSRPQKTNSPGMVPSSNSSPIPPSNKPLW